MKTVRRTTVAAAVRSGVLLGLFGLGCQAHAAVHALLIGITDYKQGNISDLQGPANDIMLMEGLLRERFNVPESNIKLLKNATHTQIEQAFKELTERVQADDQVYIHYSGHGSYYKAPTAAKEKDEQDQTWVSYGARWPNSQGKDAHDVLDKEIGTWRMALQKKTRDVVMVSDSCHSASVTRDVQVGARSSDGVLKEHPLRSQFTEKIDFTMKTRQPDSTLKNEEVGLFIGAARDIESAVELDPETNGPCSDPKRCYGVFTWNWAKALETSQPGESWGDVYQRAVANIESNTKVLQRPQMEGAANRAVFAAQFAKLTPTVPVQAVKDGNVVIGAGRLSGLTVGTELGDARPDGAKALRLEVTSVMASSAQAKLLEGSVEKGQLLKVSKYNSVEKRIPLYVGGPQVAGVDAALADRVKKAIEQARSTTLQNFDLVDKPEDADWKLLLVRPRNSASAGFASLPEHVNCTSAPCAEPELWVVRNGQLMHSKMRFPMNDEKAQLPRLLDNLGAFAKAAEVRGIASRGNVTPLKLMVSVLRPPAGSEDSCKQGANGKPGWTTLPPKPLAELSNKDIQFNDCLSFTIENKAQTTWYGYVLSVDPNFGINRVWPTARMNPDTARIAGDKSYAVDSRFYRLDSVGNETLLFIASEKQTPMDGLTDGGMRGVMTKNPLMRLTRMAVLTRSVEGDTEEGDWGAQSVSLDVPAKPAR
ncbi:MAG: caspase domain-containing protein [Leptothrix sp. (in: b-proteobacteria)]